MLAYDNAGSRNESMIKVLELQVPENVDLAAGYECLALTIALVSHC